MTHRRPRALLSLVVITLLVSSSCAGRSEPFTATDPRAAAMSDEGWTLLVRSDGPRWLPASWWREQGIDPTTLDSAGIQLRRGDDAVPYAVLDSPDGPGLLFYGEITHPAAATVAVDLGGGYVMSLSAGGRPSAVADGRPAQNLACQTSTEATVQLGEDAVFRSTAPLNPPWLWESLRPVSGITMTVVLTDIVAGTPVTFATTAWGQSSMPQEPDHHLRILWNGDVVDDHMWDGSGVETWTVTAAGSGSENQLGLLAPGGTEAPVELTWLDSVLVSWRQRLVLSETRGQRWVADGTGAACVELLDVEKTDGFIAVVRDRAGGVRYVQAGRDAGGSQLILEHGTGDVGWVGLPWTLPEPEVVRPREVLDREMLQTTEYLIVAPRAFQSALAPLVDRRAVDGRGVVVISPEAVYDTYGSGLPSASSIQALVGDLAGSGSLEALLLVGDASADPNVAWEPAAMNLPTMWVETTHVGATASDYAIATGGGDAPMVAVGRIPVTSVGDVETLVEKTLAWEPNGRLLLIADDEPAFVTLTDQLGGIAAADLVVDAGLDGARDEVLRWLDDGPGTLVYTGHGSMGLLGDEKLLLLEDGQNWRQPTVVAAWTCLCASFAHPAYASLAEAWLLAPRGVVAVVGPTGETTTAEQTSMALALQASLIRGESLGQGLLSAWRASQSENTRHGFVLLGDPYLQPMVAPVSEGGGDG